MAEVANFPSGRRYHLKDAGVDDPTAASVGELIDQLERQVNDRPTKAEVRRRIARLETKLTKWVTSRLLWPLYGFLLIVLGLMATIVYRLFE